jgi:hypothetical protein
MQTRVGQTRSRALDRNHNDAWGNLAAQNGPWQPWDHTLSDLLSQYWVNFAQRRSEWAGSLAPRR